VLAHESHGHRHPFGGVSQRNLAMGQKTVRVSDSPAKYDDALVALNGFSCRHRKTILQGAQQGIRESLKPEQSRTTSPPHNIITAGRRQRLMIKKATTHQIASQNIGCVMAEGNFEAGHEHGPGAVPRNTHRRQSDVLSVESALRRVVTPSEEVQVRDLLIYEQLAQQTAVEAV
jgi:hypothetical protein